MTNSMFSNEATNAVHQVLMLGGETNHSISYIQQRLQDAYNLGTQNPVVAPYVAIPATPPVDQPVAPVAPAAISQPVAVETPTELVAEMAAFAKKGKK